MAFTIEDEKALRRVQADKLATIAEAGSVIPARLFCNGIEEFWATLAGASINTKEEIETERVAAIWIYPAHFTDDTTGSNKPDSPEVSLDYEYYLFGQYGLEREDETEIPDIWNSQLLKFEDLFITAWLRIKEEFQGTQNIDGIDYAEKFAKAKTTSIVQLEDINDQAICKFVPGIVGFAVKLRETVIYKLRKC